MFMGHKYWCIPLLTINRYHIALLSFTTDRRYGIVLYCMPIASSTYTYLIMTTSSNGNIFRVTGPLCGEFTGQWWIPRTNTSDAELWRFLWSAPWINGWVNNGEAGDLRRHRAHYYVIVMEACTFVYPYHPVHWPIVQDHFANHIV